MRFSNSSPITEAALILTIGIVWCEIGYYYWIFLFKCPGWPGLTIASESGDQKLTNIMVIADTHIMGPIKSARVDKIRREWQMTQAYRISKQVYQPDIVLFLGDLLDEGSFSRDEIFNEACDDFERIFADTPAAIRERLIILGNHDVGFHDQMTHFPYLLHRFERRFKLVTDSIDLLQTEKVKNLNIVAINSMSFYNDTCPYCSYSIAKTNQIANSIERSHSREQSLKTRYAPILLTHIPLYRFDDTQCVHPRSMSDKVRKPNKEGDDVLHSAPSKFLLSKLKPKLILSGHTHMECSTVHKIFDGNETNTVNEITVSSYNHKYAESTPGYLLMSANSTHVYTRHCNLVEEWIIVSIYVTIVLLIISRLVVLKCKYSKQT